MVDSLVYGGLSITCYRGEYFLFLYFRSFPCSKCSLTFQTHHQLRKHSKSHDPATAKHQNNSKKVPAIILSEEQTSALANQSVDTANTVSEKMLIASAIELIENTEV